MPPKSYKELELSDEMKRLRVLDFPEFLKQCGKLWRDKKALEDEYKRKVMAGEFDEEEEEEEESYYVFNHYIETLLSRCRDGTTD
jgi:hypothetical protein